ncbi:hypothetical protein Aph01nite_23780 [Acrocarpospora phusangensis]|uniref:Uncharacterized protein n=1 Tax=Acrocarpospora phusangensis TaxID=1070424 RepID=A0A919Q8P9_9ACTN|nr:hypothetical protein [Acrocarpospora phusangensis]GIH24068.1 hypothetical protein Aph01nite_23780 [Acrocarpospora phusangensis]
MDAESTICLSDLVPALRWSRPQQVAEVLGDPRLPGGWWGSVALGRALGTTGLDWLCDRLARLAVSRWDHVALTDLLPALQVHSVDPALPGWPEPAKSVIIGLGGWHRLRRLTPGDLQGPSVPATPEVVLTIVFREIFSHIRVEAPLPEMPYEAAASAAAVPQPAVATVPPRQAPAQYPTGEFPAQTPAAQAPAASAPALPRRPGAQSPAARNGRAETGPMAATPAPTAPPAVAPAAPAATPALPPVLQPDAPLAAPVSASEHPMVALVDSLFREWNPLERAVAAERLFADEPVSLRTLAHQLNVDRDMLSQAQRAAEERVLMWLRSPDSAALTGHLFGLTEWLGTAATQEQLIGADPSHPIEVPSLRTQLWRVLVTLMPDRRLQDGWLVVGDLGGLRDRTRQVLAGKTADTDVIELLGQLGIRAHSAKAWMESMPPAPQPQRPGSAPLPPPPGALDPQSPLPRRTPGANGHQQRGGMPIPSMANSGPDPATALAALNALTGQTPRPHLVPSPRTTASPSSDPRRWQRIDVTSGHLRGEPVAVPEGYAAQLGMRPGTLLSVTGPGDNAVVLVWRDRQPVFDSLQPVLMRLNARPGDSVYVTVDGYRLDAQLTS